MLRAEPHSLLSWDVTVYDGDIPVADVDLAWVREAAEVTIGEVSCRIYREKGFGAFVLEAGGFPLVRAVKPSAFHRTFEITWDEQAYTLKARSLFGRTFDLYRGEQVIGSVFPDHAFTRKMTADLPEAMPVAVRVFLIWLVILLWKRAASSNG